MPTSDNVILGLRREHEWVSEGPPPPAGLPAITLAATTSPWHGIGLQHIDRPERVSAVIDNRVILGDEFSSGMIPPDAEYAAFRFVDPESGNRESFVIVRSNLLPEPHEIDVPVLWA